MLSYTVDESTGVIDLIVDGAITRADYEALIPVLDAQIARHGKLRVIETVRQLGPDRSVSVVGGSEMGRPAPQGDRACRGSDRPWLDRPDHPRGGRVVFGRDARVSGKPGRYRPCLGSRGLSAALKRLGNSSPV